MTRMALLAVLGAVFSLVDTWMFFPRSGGAAMFGSVGSDAVRAFASSSDSAGVDKGSEAVSNETPVELVAGRLSSDGTGEEIASESTA